MELSFKSIQHDGKLRTSNKTVQMMKRKSIYHVQVSDDI
jgi:hypothetical protein